MAPLIASAAVTHFCEAPSVDALIPVAPVTAMVWVKQACVLVAPATGLVCCVIPVGVLIVGAPELASIHTTRMSLVKLVVSPLDVAVVPAVVFWSNTMVPSSGVAAGVENDKTETHIFPTLDFPHVQLAGSPDAVFVHH